MFGVLHDGIVDRLRRACGKGLFVETEEIEVAAALRHGFAATFDDLGFEPLQFVEIGLGAENENAAIPIIVARFYVALCRLAIGLFFKAPNLERACNG